MEHFYAHGKLLLSGEYVVLKGALALAMPTKAGQRLDFFPERTATLRWQSFDHQNQCWLEVHFDSKLEITYTTHAGQSLFLQKLLQQGLSLGKGDFKPGKIETHLEFDRSWGLGSSSTLTHLVARWLGADPLALHSATQTGSAYDVACAGSSSPILFKRENGTARIEDVELPEAFKAAHFIHLNQKQLSAPEVAKFMSGKQKPEDFDRISQVSKGFAKAGSRQDLQRLIREHESLLSEMLNRPTVQSSLFPDFEGTVKSLGAWGGDFVMAVGENVHSYFRHRGFTTIFNFSEMAG